jgi:hypothetical protein
VCDQELVTSLLWFSISWREIGAPEQLAMRLGSTGTHFGAITQWQG